MSAAEALEKEIIFNDEGKPSKVVIPYDQFVDFIKAGNWDAFVSHEDVKRELGCTG